MIRELLDKRASEYKLVSERILELYGEKLLKALNFYMKTERTIRVYSVDFYEKNNNFAIVKFIAEFNVGDNVTTKDGQKHIITQETLHEFVAEKWNLLLPLSLIETGDGFKIYECIKYFDDFVNKHGIDKFTECVDSGIESFDDLLNESNEKILDDITDPIHDILNKLDDLQKVQFMIFSKDAGNKVLN